MRFGHDFHRQVVPEWSQHYVDYSLLKRLIKDTGRGGFLTIMNVDGHLDAAIANVESLLQAQPNSISTDELEICQLFGLRSTEPTVIPCVAETCLSELALLTTTYSEFQQELRKLHLFVRVNVEAVDRLLAKIVRVGGADHPPFQQFESRWNELHPAWERQLLDRLDRFDGLISNAKSQLARANQIGRPSLYLARTLFHNFCPSLTICAIQQVLQQDDSDGVIQLLTDANAGFQTT